MNKKENPGVSRRGAAMLLLFSLAVSVLLGFAMPVHAADGGRPKEYNLLTYMVQNAERVISRIEIAEKVWNTHFDTGTNFIDVYINYLRKKIDKDFETKLIHTKPGIGFILTDEKP